MTMRTVKTMMVATFVPVLTVILVTGTLVRTSTNAKSDHMTVPIMLIASIPMVDLNARLTKDIEATARQFMTLTNARMAVIPVISTLNVEILTVHIHVHVILVSTVMVVLVVISMNVIPEMIVTKMLHAITLLAVTNVSVTMGLKVMANLVPTSMNVQLIFLVMVMQRV